MEHYCARIFKLYQAHRLPKIDAPITQEKLWSLQKISKEAYRAFKGMKWLLHKVPVV